MEKWGRKGRARLRRVRTVKILSGFYALDTLDPNVVAAKKWG